MGTLKINWDQKTHFGPHGDQSPQMGTNVGAVPATKYSHFGHFFTILQMEAESDL